MHYYERWSENDKAKTTADKRMKKIEKEDLEQLSHRYEMPTSEMKYILDACSQVYFTYDNWCSKLFHYP